MDGFVQAAAGVLVAVIVLSALKRQVPEIATVLSVLVCAMVGFAAAGFCFVFRGWIDEWTGQ